MFGPIRAVHICFQGTRKSTSAVEQARRTWPTHTHTHTHTGSPVECIFIHGNVQRRYGDLEFIAHVQCS